MNFESEEIYEYPVDPELEVVGWVEAEEFEPVFDLSHVLDDDRILLRNHFRSEKDYFEAVTEVITELLNRRLRVPWTLRKKRPKGVLQRLYQLLPLEDLPVSLRDDIAVFDCSKKVGFHNADVYILIDQPSRTVTLELGSRIHVPRERAALADWICLRQSEYLPLGTAFFDRVIPARFVLKHSIEVGYCFCEESFAEAFQSLEVSFRRCASDMRKLGWKNLPDEYKSIQKNIKEDISALFEDPMYYEGG